MKINVSAPQLHAALKQAVLGGSAAPEVYRHVLLDANGFGLTVVSTDTFIERSDRLEADSGGEVGAACADASRLRAALTGLDGTVALDIDERFVQVDAGPGRRYRVLALSADEFPRQDVGDAEDVAGDPAELAGAIGTVEYAAGRNDVRRYLNSVLIEHRTVAAMNGTQVAVCPADIGVNERRQILIPIEAVKPVVAILRRDGARLAVSADGTAAVAEVDGTRLVVRLVDGQFPDWRAVVQANKADAAAAEITILRPQELRGALERMRAFSEDKTPIVYVRSDAGRLTLRPRQTANTVGDAEDAVEADIEGNADVGIRADWVAGLLGTAGEATVTWRSYGDQRIQEWRFSDRQDQHYAMPFRR